MAALLQPFQRQQQQAADRKQEQCREDRREAAEREERLEACIAEREARVEARLLQNQPTASVGYRIGAAAKEFRPFDGKEDGAPQTPALPVLDAQLKGAHLQRSLHSCNLSSDISNKPLTGNNAARNAAMNNAERIDVRQPSGRNAWKPASPSGRHAWKPVCSRPLLPPQLDIGSARRPRSSARSRGRRMGLHTSWS